MLASKPRRPSPALVISVLALFIALGGSAYAANQLAKNSVGAKQLKKNAVTAAKIKKNAVTTPKIKNNAITGAKINEGSLGAVPNATNAVNATNATNAANWNRFVILPITKAVIGQTIPLYSNGPFTFHGRCVDDGGGNPEAYTFATTTQPGASMSSTEDNYSQANFNPGIEALINFSVAGAVPETNEEYGSYYPSFTALSADGATRLGGNLSSAVNYFGSPCSFWGDVTIKS